MLFGICGCSIVTSQERTSNLRLGASDPSFARQYVFHGAFMASDVFAAGGAALREAAEKALLVNVLQLLHV